MSPVGHRRGKEMIDWIRNAKDVKETEDHKQH
jgi:hypothetical protein